MSNLKYQVYQHLLKLFANNYKSKEIN